MADELIERRLRERLGGVSIERMNGDNLAITLCTYFENADQEVDGDCGWTPDAVAGCDETLAAIHAHYTETLSAQSREIAALREALGRLEEHLVSEREDNLWNAYHTGNVKDGRWTHMFMSDGEFLARECGFDAKQYDYDDAAIRAAIPVAAIKHVQALKDAR